MGLDCSHDAFSGAYSAFNRFRQAVCRATGGSFPPHSAADIERVGHDIDEDRFEVGPGYSRESHPGLFEFLMHSDCDGDIQPEMCARVANDLESLMPLMVNCSMEAHGHIARDGGYAAVLRRFIDGCRAAAEANEPLEFA